MMTTLLLPMLMLWPPEYYQEVCVCETLWIPPRVVEFLGWWLTEKRDFNGDGITNFIDYAILCKVYESQ